MNILVLSCAALSVLSAGYGKNIDDSQEEKEQFGGPSPIYDRYDKTPMVYERMTFNPVLVPESIPGMPPHVPLVHHGNGHHHHHQHQIPTVAPEDNTKTEEVESPTTPSTTKDNPFVTQNLVVVDHNCGPGKLPDDRGECQTME